MGVGVLMPLTKEQKMAYPPDWQQISLRIRTSRAEGRCECMGECGNSHRRDVPGWHSQQCAAENGSRHPVTGSKVVLTVAHLNHHPADCRDENLVAMCQRCHLTYDSKYRQAVKDTARKWAAINEEPK